MSVFKDFPGLENLKKIKDFQGPARALLTPRLFPVNTHCARHVTIHQSRVNNNYNCKSIVMNYSLVM